LKSYTRKIMALLLFLAISALAVACGDATSTATTTAKTTAAATTTAATSTTLAATAATTTAAATSAASTTAAGAGAPVSGGRIVVAVTSAPADLDPDKTTAQEINDILTHVYEGLFEFDKNYKPQPHLAESYTLIDDNKTYDVKLRQGVLFQNGKELTSDDVEASFNRWLNLNGAGEVIKPYLDSFEKVGKYEVKFKFKQPYAPFISLIAANVANQKLLIKPKELIEKYPKDSLKEQIGTGPYSFVEWIPDQHVLLKKFNDYKALTTETSGLAGKRVAYADELEFKFVPEQAVRIAGVQSNQYQFARDIPSDQYTAFKADKSVQTYVTSPNFQGFLIFNAGNTTFKDINARQAVAYALNIDELGIAMVGNKDFYHLNGSLFNKGNIWNDPTAGDGIYNKPNPDKAKELLKKAGYNGQPIVILTEKENTVHSQAAVDLKSQLEKVGFKVELKLLDRATVVEQRKKVDGWDIHINSFKAPDPDPQVYGAWVGTNKWIGNWNDEYSKRMDAIYDKLLVETDQAKRYKIVQDWYKEWWTSLPYLKTVDYDGLYIGSATLQGYGNYTTPYFWNTWLTKK